MIFYHLTLDLNSKKDKVFIPRIPNEEITVPGEDLSTPRICVSSTIEGCLSSAPWGGRSLDEIIFSNGCSQLIKVYEFNIEDIAPKNLVSPKDLYQSDRVRDAEITNEYWIINQNISSSKSYFIQLKNYELSYPDSIPYELLKNFNESEDKYEDIIDGHFTEVVDIEYEIIECNEYTPIIHFCFQLKKNPNYNYIKEVLYDRFNSIIEDYWDKYNFEMKEQTDSFTIKGFVNTFKTPTILNNFINLINDSMEFII